MYGEALLQEKVRPVAQPQVSIKKFVPFTTLEFEAEVEAVGEVKLPDYKKIKLTKKPVTVTAKDVDEVIDNLALRTAEKEAVNRAAKQGDELTIDFTGVDAKTKEPIKGADGTDYPLLLGSNTFIPGFEDNLTGLKPGAEKSFDVTFPKDYGVKALQNKAVSFSVTVKKVSEIKKPTIDDAFAAKIGPFKTVKELKDDVKAQLTIEQQQRVERDFESELLEKITDKSTAAIPEALIDEELERLEREERQNAMYRGLTWPEYLEQQGMDEELYKTQQRPVAEKRVKAGLVLAEIAEKEKVEVTPDELQTQLTLLKGQYKDEGMQSEIDKPETRREIASRLISEKTIKQLVTYAEK
jgi:trigger factor